MRTSPRTSPSAKVQNFSSREANLKIALGLVPNVSQAARNQAITFLQPTFLAVALAVARRFYGIDPNQCAEDALQEWWACAIGVGFPGYDGQRALWPFACQGVRYTTIHSAMREQRRAHEIAYAQTHPESDPTFVESLADQDTQKDLRVALAQLPPLQQEIIKQRFTDAATLTEIAENLGISRSRVFRQVRDALERLLTALRTIAP
jgi:RNA polymerase sigma factor (sigma-70 family)